MTNKTGNNPSTPGVDETDIDPVGPTNQIETENPSGDHNSSGGVPEEKGPPSEQPTPELSKAKDRTIITAEAINRFAKYLANPVLDNKLPKPIALAVDEFIAAAPIAIPAILGFAQRLLDPNDANLAVPAQNACTTWLRSMLSITLAPKQASHILEWLELDATGSGETEV